MAATVDYTTKGYVKCSLCRGCGILFGCLFDLAYRLLGQFLCKCANACFCARKMAPETGRDRTCSISGKFMS